MRVLLTSNTGEVWLRSFEAATGCSLKRKVVSTVANHLEVFPLEIRTLFEDPAEAFQMGLALGQVTSPRQTAGFLVTAVWLRKESDPEKLFNAFS